MNIIMRANHEMSQLRDIHRQRYDLRMSELQDMAGSAGIEWQHPSY
jgi:hypothetical protein